MLKSVRGGGWVHHPECRSRFIEGEVFGSIHVFDRTAHIGETYKWAF
jgi:hypothetical protein